MVDSPLTILSDGQTTEASYCEDTVGCGLTYKSSGWQVLEPGNAYLLVLTGEHDAPANLHAAAFARLAVGDDGRLRPVEQEWTDLPPIAWLTGMSVDEAASEIQAFLQTPRPPPIWR
jgi:hypothetical protein